MRYVPLLFLGLVAAHPGPHRGFGDGQFRNHFSRHHSMPSNWHMRVRDGSSPADFGRAFHRRDNVGTVGTLGIPVDRPRLNQVQFSNGARMGIGFVQGRKLGFRLRAPF